MSIEQIVGASVILAAYAFTWYLLLKSTRIVKLIDREGLERSSDIKARLKGKISHREKK